MPYCKRRLKLLRSWQPTLILDLQKTDEFFSSEPPWVGRAEDVVIGTLGFWKFAMPFIFVSFCLRSQ